VPYVAGYSLRQAKSRLEAAGFTITKLEYVEDIATDNVRAEFVNGQQVVESKDSVVMAKVGSGVVLQVGVAPGEEQTVVPSVLGLMLRDAKHRLLEHGFNIGTPSFDSDIAVRERDTAKVYKQSILPKKRATRGGYITLSLTNDVAKVEAEISSDEARIKQEARDKAVADSIAQAERDMLESLKEANQSLLNEQPLVEGFTY
jgi:beta-lactam-binding protein with PASTA domain